MHAFLQKWYDLRMKDFVTVGDVDGRFGREDSKTRAEVRCLGENRRGKVSYSTDYKCGSFYPENVFIWGVDENDDPLPHEAVEEFCKQLRYSSTRRVLLPNRWNRGKMTWDNAVMYSPIEMKPDWYWLPKILKLRFPGAEVFGGNNEIEINIP